MEKSSVITTSTLVQNLDKWFDRVYGTIRNILQEKISYRNAFTRAVAPNTPITIPENLFT